MNPFYVGSPGLMNSSITPGTIATDKLTIIKMRFIAGSSDIKRCLVDQRAIWWSKVPRRWLQDRYCALALLNYQPTRFQIIEQRLRPITRQSFPRTVRQMHLQQAFPFAPAEYLQLRHLRKIDVMLIAVTILGLP